jgi:hypothetical protein
VHGRLAPHNAVIGGATRENGSTVVKSPLAAAGAFHLL